MRLLHKTKKPMPRFRSRSEDYDRNLELYYEYMESREEDDPRPACSCEWAGFHITKTCANCITLGYAPACDCEWRGLRNRTYRSHRCAECQPVDPLANNVWRKQILMIRKKLNAVDATPTVSASRLGALRKLFNYLYLETAFIKGNPKLQATVLAKAKEFRADKQAAPIFSLLEEVIARYEF